ncbi:DUF4097 family beta strand repeat-containing protein [Nocardioides caldifontis]|uniref:DUF4097 family beta strand repeat-containing protein n=1 Tax=Nocardioides caldifontis TaxID=2588938 RepID=UPI0011E019EE|nr:DUF4097 family beta strand repeat-containing protein [Nocardioides caldifontis]
MQHEFPADGPRQLHVDLQSARLAVTTDDTDQVVVRVEGVEAAAVTVETEGDRVVVKGPRRAGFHRPPAPVDVDVRLPRRSSLTGKLGAGDLTTTGALEHVRFAVGAGDVVLDQVLGSAVVKSGAGAIRVRELSGGGQLKTGAGTVAVEHVHGDARLTTGTGDVTLGEVDGKVAVRSGTGDLGIGRFTNGEATFKNGFGDIRVGVPESTPVWTDITTGTGRIVSDLAPLGKPAPGQPHVAVTARTATGDVYLRQLTAAP